MVPAFVRTLLLLVLVGLLAACQGLQLSPISDPPTHQHLPGKFVWNDLVTPDVAAAKIFYGEVFGWTFDTRKGYTLIRNGDRAIGGMLPAGEAQRDKVARWITTLSVADVDQAVERVRELGGEVLSDPQDMKPRGRFAFIADNQGAQLGLLRSAGGDPADAEPRIGDWLWNELWSNDLDASVSFYQTLVGYQTESVSADVRSVPYRVFSQNGKWRAGVALIPWEDVDDQWVPYVRVADVNAVIGRVKMLGGKVYLSSDGEKEEPSSVLIVDPSGGALMIERWTSPVASDANGEASK